MILGFLTVSVWTMTIIPCPITVRDRRRTLGELLPQRVADESWCEDTTELEASPPLEG